ncbi:MAG: hypothetical protein ABW100_08220, partial [Candidatus Thiodiazotropha sp. 6PLUC3]
LEILIRAGMQNSPSFFRSLRFKLLLASFTLWLIPWAGYHYLQGMESTLRQAQERLLMNRAEILANMLASEADEWLLLNPADSPGSSKSLYAFPLPEPPVIDGYDEDWLEFKSQSERFSARSAVNQAV